MQDSCAKPVWQRRYGAQSCVKKYARGLRRLRERHLDTGLFGGGAGRCLCLGVALCLCSYDVISKCNPTALPLLFLLDDSQRAAPVRRQRRLTQGPVDPYWFESQTRSPSNRRETTVKQPADRVVRAQVNPTVRLAFGSFLLARFAGAQEIIYG